MSRRWTHWTATTLSLVIVAGCAGGQAASPRPGRPTILGSAGPFTAGADSVTVLRSGEATFVEILRLIGGAADTIHIEVYEFGRSDLVAAVIRAHARGVAVTVVADTSQPATASTAEVLLAAGVDVAAYPVRARMIDHVKLLVVDSRVAVVGGINWGRHSAGNHDFDLELVGPAVDNLDRVFRRDLVTCGRPLTVPPSRPDPAVVVAATMPGSDILPMVRAAVDSSQHTLDVAMFTLTESSVVAAIEAALVRGVVVRVLLDPSERPSDASASSLRAHGVMVRMYASRGEKLHAKVAVVDGRSVVVGSANWTVSGFQHNHELAVALPDNPAVAAAIEQQFDLDWAASA